MFHWGLSVLLSLLFSSSLGSFFGDLKGTLTFFFPDHNQLLYRSRKLGHENLPVSSKNVKA